MSKIPDRESRLIRLDGQILQKQLWAQYHLALANPTAASTYVMKGYEDGKTYGEMSIEWKIKDALQTASQHIHEINRLVEAKIAIFEDDLDKLEEICLRN